MRIRIRARMTDDLIERIDGAAAQLGITRSEFMKDALVRYIELVEDNSSLPL
ncbi:MAG: ribbon-helix-helix domain-containing protein [Dehalococcoidia bacterium]